MTLLNQKPLINVIDSPRYPLEVVHFSVLKGFVIFGLLGAIFASMYVVVASIIREALEAS